jgi:hypothetical protein
MRCPDELQQPKATQNRRLNQTVPPAGPYRAALLDSWIARCTSLGIPHTENFTLAAALATPIELREWAIHGLPLERVSIDNGVLVVRGGCRWPLMIDPQEQGTRCGWGWGKGQPVRGFARLSGPQPQQQSYDDMMGHINARMICVPGGSSPSSKPVACGSWRPPPRRSPPRSRLPCAQACPCLWRI